jgi:hypothetical protein
MHERKFISYKIPGEIMKNILNLEEPDIGMSGLSNYFQQFPFHKWGGMVKNRRGSDFSGRL